jgi:hypothetical protein
MDGVGLVLLSVFSLPQRDSLRIEEPSSQKERTMTILKDFTDDGPRGCFANVRMDNGDPCWISIADTGVLVKKSKIGLFGEKLYESKEPGKTVTALWKLYPESLTPPEIKHIVLQAFTNAVLHCSDMAEVKKVLNGASETSGDDSE